MSTTKYCKDCRHFCDMLCLSPERPKTEPVLGTDDPHCYCSVMRSESHHCGPFANWFELRIKDQVTIDPGKGWRLLIPKKDIIQSSDEYYLDGQWILWANLHSCPVEMAPWPVRRRITPEIANCICGKKARPVSSYHIACNDLSCWRGPDKPTVTEAVEAWNQLMEKVNK